MQEGNLAVLLLMKTHRESHTSGWLVLMVLMVVGRQTPSEAKNESERPTRGPPTTKGAAAAVRQRRWCCR